MQLQKCTIKDVPKLALLNKQLIEDRQEKNFLCHKGRRALSNRVGGKNL